MKFLTINEPNGDTSQFYYQPKFLDKKETEIIESWLNSLDNFRKNPSFNKNKVARYQKWFQEDGKYFCPKWEGTYKRWEAFNYDNILIQIQKLIINKLDKLNLESRGCLVNMYPDGKHYIKPHRDTDLAFGKEPVIIGISLGSTRQIKFSRILYNGSNRFLSKKDKNNSHLDFSFNLENASLFIMSGSSQKYWSHEIPPCNESLCRYSLTFREHIV